MTDQAVGEFESLWEAAGSRVAGALDGASAVVVLGHDPIATASVALGIGRAQAARRRVAVGDLIGDVAPIRELVTDDDPHGLTDAFLYGVSLNKIARQIDAVGNLHVLPSGSDQVVQEEILRNDRWRRLASGFHETGALLLLAAPAAVPGVEDLIGMLDGVVVVGDAPARFLPLACSPRCLRDSAIDRRAPQCEARTSSCPNRRASGSSVGRSGIGVAAGRPRSRSRSGEVPNERSQRRCSALRRDSAAASDSRRFRVSVIDSSPPLVVSNPADSAYVSPFAVQIAMVDTEDGAALRVRSGGGDFPVGTYAPVSRGADRGTWYKVVTGAYVDRKRADQLLGFLRQRGLVPQGIGAR